MHYLLEMYFPNLERVGAGTEGIKWTLDMLGGLGKPSLNSQHVTVILSPGVPAGH